MFEHILIPIAASSGLEHIRAHAINIGSVSGATITLLLVLSSDRDKEQHQFVDPLDWNLRKIQAEASLNQIAETFKDEGLNVDTAILESPESERLLQYVQSHEVNLIILAKQTQYVSDWAFTLMKDSGIPVLIVPTTGYLLKDGKTLSYQKIFVPLDGSQRAEAALPLATTLAYLCKAQLLLSHVIRRPEMPRRGPLSHEEIELAERVVESNRQEAERYFDQLATRISGHVQTLLTINDNVTTTLQQSVEQEGVDLVIMSAHGYTGEARWPYGSITSSFIAYSRKPVLVIQDLPARAFHYDDERFIRDTKVR